MVNLIRKLFGYWEVWHMVLATWLYIFLFNYVWNENKQLSLISVMGVAIIWEILEYFREQVKGFESYNGNRKAFFLNSIKDLLAALVSCLVCTGLL